jgi:antitoxin component YwqK of YwqJK toxin-antitoxin module
LLAVSAVAATALACGGGEAQAPKAEVVVPTEVDSGDAEAYAKSNQLELVRFDLNRDQRPDVFKFYRSDADATAAGQRTQRLVRKDMDLNNDGKVDVVRMYDDKGGVKEERTDLDFDGRFDEVALYDKGAVARKDIDLNYDGKADVVRFYVEGKITRIESDRTGDGTVDTWEYYENGELDRVGVDLDGDGIVDSWERSKKAEAATTPPQTAPSTPAEAAPASDGGAETTERPPAKQGS